MTNPHYCIHNFAPAVNLANGYGYRKCVFCGITKSGWMKSPAMHRILVNADTDGKYHDTSRIRTAMENIKRQPFFN